jgi:hypothetical protein
MVKSPAVIAVAFAVPVWLHTNRAADAVHPGGRAPATIGRVVIACVAALAGAAAVGAVVTVACRLGTGWTHQVSTGAGWVSWLSLPSGAAMLAKVLAGQIHHLKTVDDSMRLARAIGEAVAAALAAGMWVLALRRAPLTCLAVALAAAALLAPSVQPWYYCWALALAGLVVHSRRLIVALAAVSIAFPVMITPSGVGLESNPSAVAILLGAGALAWLALRAGATTPDGFDRSAPDDDRPDHPGAEVRADDGAEFGDVQLPHLRQRGT